MLYLVIGNNEPQIRNFIKSRRTGFPANTTHDFEKKGHTCAEIADIVYATSIFSSRKLIIIYPSTISDINFPKEFLKHVSKAKDVELIIIGSRLIKTTNAYKQIKQFANVKDFSKKKDYSHFNITDTLFIHQNKGLALTQLTQVQNFNENYYGIINALQLGLRNYLSMKKNNKTWKTLHPFVKKKTKQSKLTEDTAKKLYKKLFDLDVGIKTSKDTPLNLLQDFMLEYELQDRA